MAKYQNITDGIISSFKNIIGEENVSSKKEILEAYSHDETEDLSYLPEAVLFPCNAKEISQLVKLCHDHNIPITPRAGGTGLSGGALPVKGGVALSIKRLDKILKIDEDNMQVTTEPGVITQVLQEAVIEKGLYYPPDPASRGTCFIGGNIAENSGGPRAVKYGVVKDYVLNLEVVLPNGDIIWTGANTLKNSTGYNLTQLMVGSEGTLGIVTKIVLRLIPHPPHTLTMLAPFKKMEKASEAVAEIFKAGIIPSALEFMERDAIDWTIDLLGDVNLPVEDDVEAHLLIEVDGFKKELLFEDCEKITEVLEQFDVGEVLFAESAKQKESLWHLRSRVSEAVKSRSVYKEEDTVVPRAELPTLLQHVKQVGRKYGFKSVCYGHVGDGNLHVNIIKGDLSEEMWNHTLKEGIREIFTKVKDLGGTISGEHGIGWVQREYMDIVFSAEEMDWMWKIKKLFDPNMIMNPGKIFPSEMEN